MHARVLLPICVIAVWACSEPVAPESPGVFFTLTAGDHHTCALLQDGTAYCWGDNSSNQIGTSLTGDRYPLPQVVSTELRFSQIGAGIVHTCALTANGTAYCWGSNFTGVLGNAAAPSSRVPIRVDGGLTFTALAVGESHTCALTATGAAYCWGANDWREIGDTSATRVLSPIAVAGGHAFMTIAAGAAFTCGIEAGGSAYCWGENDFGQLGSGDTARKIGVPVAVSGGLAFRSIAGGGAHACGVTTTNAVYCWGWSVFGNLGIGPDTGIYRTPQRVRGDQSYTAIDVGDFHSCALSVDGALACWGFDGRNQLGGIGRDKCSTGPYPNDYVTCALTPVTVAPGHYFQAMTAGGQYTCGLAFNNAAFCWGQNDEGQIGNGRVEATVAAPTRVPDPPPLPPPPP